MKARVRGYAPWHRVRIGIVGVGNIATLNVPGYLEHEQLRRRGAVRPAAGRARTAGARVGVDRSYTTLDDLLADDEIDAVEILSPTPLHAEHVIAALAAGKHVSCRSRSRTPCATGGAWSRRPTPPGVDVPRHRALLPLPAAREGA